MIGLGVAVLMLLAITVPASVFYVNAGNPVPSSPYNTWATAATNIQDAINAAGNGDTVLVTNGIYAYGGLAVAGTLTNRVALTNALTVQSVNGPWVTSIQGVGATNGTLAVRCAWLTNGASLIGFTLTHGATQNSGDAASLESGGGVWCASSNALVKNCVIVSNTAASNGGGVYQGTVIGSLLSSNGVTISSGGAAYKSVLQNCTVISNSTVGVAIPLAMTNCIIYYNGSAGNYSASGSAFSHCCTTPALAGTANFTAAPQLFADGVHLSGGSPCISAGVNPVTGNDVFGNAWANPPAVGCAEWTQQPLVTTPQVRLSGNPVGFSAGNEASGGTLPLNFFWLKDGSPLQDNGHFSSTQTSNLVATGVSLADAGAYQVVVSNAFGVVTSSVVQLVAHCVAVAGTNPVVPYSSWATAATNIQDAITASGAGDIVLVTNGLYASGGKSMDGLITNRVTLDKPILLQSVNGSGMTIIQGASDPTSTNGPGAIRCAWLTNNTILSGFTLQGGATREMNTGGKSSYGGGVLGSSTNAMVCNSIITKNFASNEGGGAELATLIGCTLSGNVATTGSGGGAEICNLINCLVTGNFANQSSGGGADNCNLRNCALIKNSTYFNGGGANGGSLVNCTVSANISSGYSVGYGAAVYGATVNNSIIYGNLSRTSYPNTNYASCTLAYCCADPLPSGTGNIDVNPQILGDDFHVAATSPCLGAGNASVVSGDDIDGQPWNNPPAIGCDEWYPMPIIGAQPGFQVASPAYGLTFNVIAAGQTPFSYSWSQNGTPIQDDGHHSNSATANLMINHFGPADAGSYQVVVTNSAGAVTSAVVQVVIHAVNAAGVNPVSPYSSWSTAATNIQDAINAAVPGDIVLVTNGIYSNGGMAMSGSLTNRVALNTAITVMSANGYRFTTIQGAWDPIATNGPGAVRCAWLADGAVLTGFTLQNGATFASGDAFSGGPLESGAAVWCNSTNGVVANCVLSNNMAIYGGGMANGTLNNSLVTANSATYGGGAYAATLNNCTVEYNLNPTTYPNRGAGTYNGFTRNSIVANNYDYLAPGFVDGTLDNQSSLARPTYYYYCDTSPNMLLSGTGNINVDPELLDQFHISSLSPCRSAGNAAYASGYDLDDEPWNNPPSIGCDEVVPADLTGPLSVAISETPTNLLVNRYGFFTGMLSGRGAYVGWTLGGGLTATNVGQNIYYQFTNAGSYTVTFTAYNNDNPAGVATNITIQVQPLIMPQLQSPVMLTNGFQFQFGGQVSAQYTIQYTTNLTLPASWQTLQTIYYNFQNLVQIVDSPGPNTVRFYRVLVQ